jgi:ATP-dependent RNA helicase DDX24/MAK5
LLFTVLILLQGSGKTLAYGIPILSSLLKDAELKPPQHKRTLSALILTPTRELALQVSSHLNDCLSDLASVQAIEQTTVPKKKQGKQTAISSPPSSKQPKGPPLVSVAAVVGGMSAQKQRRVLSRGVDVLVVTPGRFWDLLEEVRQ